MKIETTVRVWREGKQYIAHALPLDVSSAGATPEAARQALREAAELFIAAAREHGSLQEVLEECGYTAEGDRWIAPPIVTEHRDVMAV